MDLLSGYGNESDPEVETQEQAHKKDQGAAAAMKQPEPMMQLPNPLADADQQPNQSSR